MTATSALSHGSPGSPSAGTDQTEVSRREVIAMTEQPGPKVTPAAAASILAERDPVIARLLDQTGPPKLARPVESPFASLVRAIVYQQLAGRAAAAIHGRLMAALDGDVRPETLIALSD